jgi:transposase
VALVQGFAGLLRATRNDLPGLGLGRWEAAAVRAGLPEFAAFVAKLRKDAAAVRAALVLPHSQGQIEGQIARVKLLKRAMYGRAKVDLLRQRVLYPAAP